MAENYGHILVRSATPRLREQEASQSAMEETSEATSDYFQSCREEGRSDRVVSGLGMNPSLRLHSFVADTRSDVHRNDEFSQRSLCGSYYAAGEPGDNVSLRVTQQSRQEVSNDI